MILKNNKSNNCIDEEIILKDILLSEKYLSIKYNEYINSFSNKELCKYLNVYINEINNIIRNLNDLIFSFGYQTFYISEEKDIQELTKNHNY